jgi:small-conductance mechanosensitive channel
VLTLGISVLANVLGSVYLAELLTGATLNSALLANVLFASAVVLTGMLTVLLRTRAARSLAAVRTHRELLNSRIATTVRGAALIAWTGSTLVMFGVLDPMLATVGAILARHWTVGSVQLSLGDLLAFGVTLWIASLVSRFIRFVLQEDVLPRIALARGVAGAVSMVVHYTVLGIGFVFAIAAAGIDLSRLALLVGAFGVGLGFGLQTVVNNFVSGLILLFERPIQVGDTIQVGELLGEVTRIGIRASRVRTFDGAEVIVPNGQLISSEVVNWTLSDRLRRLEVDIGVAYGTDPKPVLEILVDAAKGQSGVLPDPEPHSLFRGFGDSSLDFTLRFWTADFENFLRVKSQVTVAVNDAIVEAGIEIPFPQRDLHVRSVEPSVANMVAGKRRS